jgi:hypothetical protein
MLVSVARSGGLAGLMLVWEVEVDRQPDRDAWEGLLAEVPWNSVPAGSLGPGGAAPIEPDRFVYRIRCAPHEARLGERQLTGPWRTLVDRVRDTVEPRRATPGAR